MTLTPHNSGWIEVICGSMFSGKTEELIRRIRRAEIAKMNTIIFKPQIDDRYSSSHVVSHNQSKLASKLVKNSQEILDESSKMDVIGIDEAQFFDDLLGLPKEKMRELFNTVEVDDIPLAFKGQEDKLNLARTILDVAKKKNVRLIDSSNFQNGDNSNLLFFKKTFLYQSSDNLIVNKKNLGAGLSRNIGIKKSRGKYIAFLDSDDLWLKNKLKTQIQLMEK